LWAGDILGTYALDGFFASLPPPLAQNTAGLGRHPSFAFHLLFFGLATRYSITRQVNPQV